MFSGFHRPRSNFYRLPNDWFDRWRAVRATQDRIIGPLKVTEYVIKWTWGYQNFDRPIRISWHHFQYGRLVGKERLDRGTGLSSRSLNEAINIVLDLGFLERHGDVKEPLYLPHLRPAAEDTPGFLANDVDVTIAGFGSPHANYFLVPALWTDLITDVSSEALILAMEYLFRHTWGWDGGWERPCWLSAEEIAAGRRYRSPERAGERYDSGIGYADRTLREALAEGIRRGWIVWQETETGGRIYALHLKGMRVAEDGQFLGMAGKRADERAPLGTTTPAVMPEMTADDLKRIAQLETQVHLLTQQVQALIGQTLAPDIAPTEANVVPTEANVVPAAESKAPAEQSKAPAAESKALAEQSKAPAAESKAPAEQSKAPAAESKAPAAESKAPAAESKAPAAEKSIVPTAESKAPTAESKAPTAESKAGGGGKYSTYYTDTLKTPPQTPPPADTRGTPPTRAETDTRRSPAQVENGGGAAESVLPEDLRRLLNDMEYRGQQAWRELAAAFQEEPARIGGWIRYVNDHRDEFQQPAGFLLQTVIRDGAPLPAGASPPQRAERTVCKICGGRGTIQLLVPPGDPDYGRIYPCPLCQGKAS